MRLVVFVHCRQFYVSAERAASTPDDSPMAVVRDGIVIDASSEAKGWDVRLGISRRLACQRYQGLQCVPYNPDHYTTCFHKVWSAFAVATPLVEPIDFHEGYIDLMGCMPRGKSLEGLMGELTRRLRSEIGLEVIWSGGQDKWIARVTCGENRWIAPEEESAFLKTVRVTKLGLPDNLCESLSRFQIHTVADFMKLPRSFLQMHLQLPHNFWQSYLVRDTSPVKALYPPPTLEVQEEIHWGEAEEITRAIQSLAAKTEELLGKHHHQSGSIKVIVGSCDREEIVEFKPSKPITKSLHIENNLRRVLGDRLSKGASQIKLILGDLLPTPREQVELWQRKTDFEQRTEQLEKARLVLGRKYSFRTIQNGSDYAKEIPPRFAQLIYGRKGMYLH